MAIRYFIEIEDFKFNNRRLITSWIKGVIESYQKVCGEISFIFCSDEQLLEINQSFLKHNYYTDVITFNYNEDIIVSGDIYISIDRILENSTNLSVKFEAELMRVMIHGILHLLGFNDKTKQEERQMRLLEDKYLAVSGKKT